MLVLDFYDKIKAEINSQNVNITELADTLGVSRGTVYNLGENTKIGIVFKLLNALKKQPCDFFCNEGVNYTDNDNKHLSLVGEGSINYGIDYKQKYLDLIERHTKLLEEMLRMKNPLQPFKHDKTTKT